MITLRTMTATVLLLGVNAAMAQEQTLQTGPSAQTITEISKPNPIQEPEKEDGWQFAVGIPAWLPGVDGTIGLKGVTGPVDFDVGDWWKTLDEIQFLAYFRVEASKGRFGVLADLVAVGLGDDLKGSDDVSKLHVYLEEYMGDLAVRWRLIDSEKGSLDALLGVRYTRLYQEYTPTGDEAKIETLSSELVDAGAGQVRNIIRNKLDGLKPDLAMGPMSGEVGEPLRRRIETILQNKGGLTKAQLTKKISDELMKVLNTRQSRTDDWFDPYVGLRGRLNFKNRFYAQARADVGGFGIGSDLMWQASAGVGRQITKHIYAEFAYRALAFDYDKNGLIFDVINHGPEITVGIKF